jgi:hypothetical protein
LGSEHAFNAQTAPKPMQSAGIWLAETDFDLENRLSSRDFAPERRQDVTPENRGVPGSSPGLAIEESPVVAGYSGFR